MKKESFLGRPVKHHSPARDYPRSASRPIEHTEHLTEEELKWLEQKRLEIERERRLREKLEQDRKNRERLELYKLGIQKV
jgi:hypothetical protein